MRFARVAVGCEHGGSAAVALDHQGVEVGRLGGVHGLESEVIDYDQLGPD